MQTRAGAERLHRRRSARRRLDPYGQLVKMLLPRAQSIVIYDRMGVAVWVSEGLDDSCAAPAGAGDAAPELAEPGSQDEASPRTAGGEQASYVFMLRDTPARCSAASA